MLKRIGLRLRSLLAGLAAALAMTAVGGSAWAGAFLDGSLPDLKPEERVKVAQPRAAQMMFEFQTKGVANQRATTQVKTWVVETAQASGLFSTLGEAAVPDGGLLTITINNLPSEGAASKGFVTGLTFGLKGSTVADYYDCTFEYAAAPGAPKVVKTLRHTIYFTIGATGAPENAVKMKNVMAAVEGMVRQSVSHGLNDLGRDAVFSGPAAALPPEPTPGSTPEPAPIPAAATPTGVL